jgi:(R,R)-butanediol dehydrogenase/meso-butanediol dehydrogenase/diacetyl reductase
MCQKLAFLGGSNKLGGGLSEFVAVEEAHCLPLPDTVSLEYAAVIEPLVVCHHAAKVAGVKLKGLDVLILGGGPVGSALISILRAHEVGRIFLSEPTAKRKEQNKRAVDTVIDPRSEKVGDVCRELTGGKGVDVVFDCAGVQPGLEAGFDALKHSGTFVNVAVWEKPVSLATTARRLITIDTVVADPDPVPDILLQGDQYQEFVLLQRRGFQGGHGIDEQG